jgi:hypothetical protein
MQIIEYFKSLIGFEINHRQDKWLFQNTMFHVPNGLVFGTKKTKEDNEMQKFLQHTKAPKLWTNFKDKAFLL